MTDDRQSTSQYGDSARREMLPFVPAAARRVLDVGCNSGGFGAALRAERGAEVWGVEPNAAAARQAESRLDRVFCARFDAGLALPTAHFDAVVFNDVLEHIDDPWSALRFAATLLATGGVVVAAIPNLRHIDNLEHILLEGDFRYESHGVRDRTHLRFFTRRSAARLFDESGYDVLQAAGINASWWSRSPWRRLAFRLWRVRLEDTKYTQFAFVARPRTD